MQIFPTREAIIEVYRMCQGTPPVSWSILAHGKTAIDYPSWVRSTSASESKVTPPFPVAACSVSLILFLFWGNTLIKFLTAWYLQPFFGVSHLACVLFMFIYLCVFCALDATVGYQRLWRKKFCCRKDGLMLNRCKKSIFHLWIKKNISFFFLAL